MKTSASKDVAARWVALLVLLATWVPFIAAILQFRSDGAATFIYGDIALRPGRVEPCCWPA